MAVEKITLIFLLSFCLIHGEDSPVPFITKCRGTDTACITKSSQEAVSTFANGLPQFHIDNLDPVTFPFVDASSPQLKFLIHDMNVKGIRNCQINKVSRDLQKSKINAELQCNLNIDGQYEMDGNILVLKIQGKGDARVEINELHCNVEGDLEEYVGKDGEKYWKITGYNFTFKVLGKSKLEFENLFNGNAVLGQAVRELFESSPNAVIEEVGEPIVNIFIKEAIVKNVNRMFKHVPSKYLYIE